MFCFFVSASVLDFRRVGGCVLLSGKLCCGALFLACSAGVFQGYACCCWRLGYWDELEEGKLEEKIFVIHWALCQRGKSEQSRCFAIELGMRL